MSPESVKILATLDKGSSVKMLIKKPTRNPITISPRIRFDVFDLSLLGWDQYH